MDAEAIRSASLFPLLSLTSQVLFLLDGNLHKYNLRSITIQGTSGSLAKPLLYGEGSAIAIIAPFVALLLGVLTIRSTLFLSLLLFGLWTVAYALAFADSTQRFYYVSWGLILMVISSVFMTALNYTAALILLVVIALIIYFASARWGITDRTTKKNKNKDKAQSTGEEARPPPAP